MSRYNLYPTHPESDKIEISLGYDENLLGFWMFIEDTSGSNGQEDVFLFHNMDDIPGVRMSLQGVETALAFWGIGLPKDLVNCLIQDAEASGYTQHLAESNALMELNDFELFKGWINSSDWIPRAPLAQGWDKVGS